MSSSKPISETVYFKQPIQDEFHRSTLGNCINKGAWTALALGIIVLLGTMVGFLASQSLLPQHLSSYLGLLTDQRWILLGVGSGLVVMGGLGKLCLRRYDQKFIEQTKDLNREFDTESQFISAASKTNPPFIPHKRARDMRFYALQVDKFEKGYTAMGVLSETLELKNTKYTYVVPQGLYRICTKDSKGYTVHHYENLSSFQKATKSFDSKKYASVPLVDTSNIQQFVHHVN